MRRIAAVALLCGVTILIGGCADPNIKPTHLDFGTATDTVSMGPTLRLVTERPRPIDEYHWLPTTCSEPSPDVAVAFGRSIAAQGSYAETGGPSVSGSANAATTETATALAGRTAGVLALRDGLFAACQSYLNGVLGHDAYAVILSQYGNLLVALAGTGTGGNPIQFTSQDAAVGAMLVACLSEHDPTRIRPAAVNGKVETNPLLSLRTCNYLMSQIAQGKLLAPPKPAPGGKQQTAQAKGPKAGEKIVTTTVTEKSGAPFVPVAATGLAAKP